MQVAIHTDTLNEAGYLESTLAAIAGRPIHTYHTEGAGGGHAPDIIRAAGVPERPAQLDQPDPAAHPQHPRRAPRHVDGLPPPEPLDPRGPGLRGVADPAVDHGRRGRAARPRRDLDDRLGLPGDGPDRRDRHPHLADRARDEAAARCRCPATVRPTTSGPAGTSRSTPSRRPSRMAWPARSARSSRASWPTSCCGTRRSSAVRPDLVIKAGVIAWAPWAMPTRRSRRRSRSCRADVRRVRRAAGAARRCSSSRRPRSRPGWPTAGPANAGWSPTDDVSRLSKADLPINDALPRDPGRPGDLRRAHRRRASWSPQPAEVLPMAQRYFLF